MNVAVRYHPFGLPVHRISLFEYRRVASRIHGAFEDMGDASETYTVVTSEDSSAAYYKLSMGLVKPQL